MNTWWLHIEGSGLSYLKAVMAEDVEAAIESVQGAIHDGTEVSQGHAPTEMPGCRDCPHREECLESLWEEGSRFGDPRQWTFQDCSSVHTCPACMEKTINFYEGPKAKTHNIVPDECPRWGPAAGSALSCEWCREAWEQIREAHPLYQERLAASARLFDGLLEAAQERQGRPENVESLTERRQRKENVRMMTETMNSTTILQEAVEDPEQEPRFNRALTLLSEFWPSVMECPQFQQEWARLRNGGLKEWQVNMFYADWLEALFLAQERHPRNAEGLVREWVLAFLEKGPALRGWCRIPLPERRLLVRVWEGIARQTLAE